MENYSLSWEIAALMKMAVEMATVSMEKPSGALPIPGGVIGAEELMSPDLGREWRAHGRCYTFFDALAIPIPHNLYFTTTTNGFDTWWSMWKTHAFRRALGPLLRQLDAEYDIPAHQEQDGPEPTQIDGSPFTFLPPAPVVLFCQNSPALKKINEISSGDGEEVPMPSATLDLAASTSVAGQVAPGQAPAQPIIPTAAPPSLGEGCDPSSLLTFDPESIEPAAPKASEEPSLEMVHGPLQRLKALLSSSVEILVENPEAIKGILDEIQPHLPVTLQVKLWPAVTLSAFKSRVQSARQRITLRRAQLPLRADIAEKCQRLNEKKTALDAKVLANNAELETLRKELESLEEKVRMTKQLIQKGFIARSREEAQGLTADLKTDLAEIRALSGQLVTGKDEDDETEIAEVDRIRLPFALLMNFFRRISLYRAALFSTCAVLCLGFFSRCTYASRMAESIGGHLAR
ncbi:hypothetical protein QYE76_064066 [Lolium multiflorum]|uniref:Uncharacterized protein n=1 Tax=Lolium multiflorum TaxID=4521 RepID=A0AAD8W7A4_LOLMU|nr:hypothetical protein QYE76_064066 [Lolium multiflorum]